MSITEYYEQNKQDAEWFEGNRPREYRQINAMWEIIKAAAEAGIERDAKRYRAIADPCSGAERVIFYHVDKEGFCKRLKSGQALDDAVDSLSV
jgi:hypothetical protein